MKVLPLYITSSFSGGSGTSTSDIPKPQITLITDVSNKVFGTVTKVVPSGLSSPIMSTSVSASSMTQSVFASSKQITDTSSHQTNHA